MSAGKEALAYAQRFAWPIFPTRLIKLASGRVDKVPCIKDWPTAASTDPAQIERWWRRWPDAVISTPTGKRSGVIVLDIDVKHDRNGFDRLGELGGGILPDTPMAHTRSGGVHIYFARGAIEIRNSAGTKGLGVGLDIRGDGGQVVLPSAASGYFWDPSHNFDTVALMPAPAWLGHREVPERRHQGQRRTGERFDAVRLLDEACGNIRGAGPGDKYHTVRREPFIVGCLVRDGFLDQRTAWHAIEGALASLQRHADNVDHMWNAAKGAFAEGLAAPTARRVRS